MGLDKICPPSSFGPKKRCGASLRGQPRAAVPTWVHSTIFPLR